MKIQSVYSIHIYYIVYYFLMSLLRETILSFYPAGAHMRALVDEPLFQQNDAAQLGVLRMCYEGYPEMIDEMYDLSNLLEIFDSENDKDFLEELVEDFGDNGYVVWRWFQNSPCRQIKILLIKMYEYSHWVNTVDNGCDFDVHIDTIIEHIQTNRSMEHAAILAGELDEDSIEMPTSKRCAIKMFKDEISGQVVITD